MEYAYDAFSRQVLNRVQDANGVREYTRIWNGRQSIEEWENGQLSKSFIYGARVSEPVQMIRHTEGGLGQYFYAFNGRGFVTALVDPLGKPVERYRYDVFRQPFLSERNGQPVNEMISSSPLGNPFLGCGRLWDSDIGSSFGLGSEYDPWTGQVTNPESGPGEPGCENDYSGGENPGIRVRRDTLRSQLLRAMI